MDAASLGPDVLSVSPIRVEGAYAGVTADAFRLFGRISARITAVCAKCLDEAVYDLDLPLEETVLRAGSLDSEPSEDRFTFTGDALDMDEMLRTYVLLALPLRYICGCLPERIQEMDAAAAEARRDISPFAVLLQNMEEV